MADDKPDIKRDPTDLTVETSLKEILATTGEIAYVWDLESDKIQWVNMPDNPETQFILSVKTGASFKKLLAYEDQQVREDRLTESLQADSHIEVGYEVLTEEGNAHWISERAAVLQEEGTPQRIVGSIRVGSQESTPSDQIDQLTGLYNENKLRLSLDKIIPDAVERSVPGAYIIVGIDKLSIINDVYGSDTAKEVVIRIGKLLQKCVREQDIVGRVTTNQFGIIVEECDEDGQTLIVENILNTIRQSSIETAKGSLKLTVSIGTVLFPERAKSTQEVFIRGESAFNDALKSGRNCYRRFSFAENSQEVQERTIAIADRVREAIDEETFQFAFQPVVCSFTHEIKFYECLLRMAQEGKAPIQAFEFIKVAEQLGLTKQIDIIVLKNALQALEQNLDLTLSINISAFNANDGEWLQTLMSGVYSKEELAQRLIIEITETAALHDEKDAEKFFRIVRSLGCRVALDDFGEGYTSFKQLKMFPVDIVKIDGSFIQGITNNTGKQLFIKTLLELAEGYDMTIVGECIENKEEYELLRAFGLHLQQGHYFGKPMILAPDKLDEFFAAEIAETEKAE